MNGPDPEVITRLHDARPLGAPIRHAACSEVSIMPGPHAVVIAAILLFPWSLVLTAVIATVWPKARALARPRHLR